MFATGKTMFSRSIFFRPISLSLQMTGKALSAYSCKVSYFQRLNSSQKKTEAEPQTVDYESVKKAIENINTLIIDVREPDEIKEHGKIPNSINIPLSAVTSVLSSMSDKDFQQTFLRLKPKEDTEMIFYCMIGKRSGMAQKNALNLGYKNAKNYTGSWTDWADKSNLTTS